MFRTLPIALLLAVSLPAGAAGSNLVTAPQGGVARWTGMPAKECGVYGKRYPAVDAVCYYPVDIATKPGRYQIALYDQDGKQHLGTMQVEQAPFSDIDIELPEKLAYYLDPSAEQKTRAANERGEVMKLFQAKVAAPQFSLPLGKPTATLPKSEDDFGSRRTFNHKVKSTHSGRDYPIGSGQAVRAVADGTVVLAADHFFTGNAVYVDHGGGLISMNFHLADIAVESGQAVKRGDKLGTIGATGRATGPHLHLGVRWVGKRIDPALLLDSPDKLPSVADTKAEAEAKIDNAEAKDPPETDEVEDEG